MNLQAQNAELALTAQQVDKTQQVVKFLVVGSPEDLKSLEDSIKEWKTKNNKTFNQLGVTSELKQIPIVEIRNKE